MATKGYLDRPAIKAKTIRLLLDGKSLRETAKLVSTPHQPVTNQAVSAFRRRYADELRKGEKSIEQHAIGIAIANKRHRLQVYQEALDLLLREMRVRGVTYVVTRTSDDGEVQTITEKINEPLIRSLDRLLRRAAEEMGQVPRWQAPSEGQGYGNPGSVALAGQVETQNVVVVYRGGPDLHPGYVPTFAP